MPYNGEKASKGGHADFVKNPDVMSFLAECEYMREPNSTEASLIASAYQKILLAVPPDLPRYVVASDASKSDTPINDKLPSTQIGFIKVSQVLIGMDRYAELIDPASRFVDPFKAAEMHRNASAITFTLPGSNIRFQGAKSVKDGFRRAVFKQLNTNRAKDNSHFLLTETLLQLNNGIIEFSLCPSCGIENNFQFITNEVQHCSHCREPVFITDWLRLHEDISDFGNNTSAMTRMMNVIEHLLLVTLINQVFSVSPKSLSTMAFVIDGPLAIFGQPAKLHSRIMEFLFRINNRLAELNLNPILVIGLQKTGDVMDHANILNKFLPPGVIKL
ncbi:hypothetical protein VW20_003976, partial [Salmonella enterica subsp. salamae]|nr:hypothetical protein [Salmonella enterica subsp. salamae]